jgi:hypothetical protein
MIELEVLHHEQEEVCNQKRNNNSVPIVLELILFKGCKVRRWRKLKMFSFLSLIYFIYWLFVTFFDILILTWL